MPVRLPRQVKSVVREINLTLTSLENNPIHKYLNTNKLNILPKVQEPTCLFFPSVLIWKNNSKQQSIK